MVTHKTDIFEKMNSTYRKPESRRYHRYSLPEGADKSNVLPLPEALNTIQAHKAVLHYDNRVEVELFSPGKKLPLELRKAVVQHRKELVNMMHEGDARTCVNARLHRFSWYRDGDRLFCQVCRELDSAIERGTYDNTSG